MEQYDSINTELNEQELARVTGGGWLGAILKGGKSAGRHTRNGAAGYGAATIIGGAASHGGGTVAVAGGGGGAVGGGDGIVHIVGPKVDQHGNIY